MKKLMILGGGPNQIPLIKAAKKNGYHVIVCDYSESAPGVELADAAEGKGIRRAWIFCRGQL